MLTKNDIFRIIDHPPGGQVFLVPSPGDVRSALTYGAMVALAERTLCEIHIGGLGSGSTVAVVLPNGPEMASCFIAIASGMIVAPLNPAYTATELERYFLDLGVHAVITQRETSAAEVGIRLGLAVYEMIPSPHTTGDFRLSLLSERVRYKPDRPDNIALILHTSGTTSKPKIVPLTRVNLVSSARNVANALRLKQSDKCINIMPLFHIHGLVGCLLSSVSVGANLQCFSTFNVYEFVDNMEKTTASWYSAVPTIHQTIVARIKRRVQFRPSESLRFIRSSSAALPTQTLKDLEQAFGVPVIESYGMTEASHQMTSNPLPPAVRKPGSVGIPFGPQVAIVDADWSIVPAGKSGEVVIRGESVIARYEGNEAANVDSIRDGWLRTGDAGYFDDDGYLYLTGRLKEIINRGGEKISPLEVDNALTSHPAVHQALTFAVSHQTLGEDVAAAVVLRDDYLFSETELKAFVGERLARFKVPKRIVCVPELPKGPTGKLQRINMVEILTRRGYWPPV